jgi:hypothetical protein
MDCSKGCNFDSMLLAGKPIHHINPITFAYSEGAFFYYECMVCGKTMIHSVEVKYDSRIKSDSQYLLKGYLPFNHYKSQNIEWEW